MFDKDLIKAMKEIDERFDKSFDFISRSRVSESELLLERVRKYPNGFKFYTPSLSGEDLKIVEVVSSELPNLSLGRSQVIYNCRCDALLTEDATFISLCTDTIDQAISKFGTPDQEA